MQNITNQPPLPSLPRAGFLTSIERAQDEVDRLSAWPDVVDVMHEHEMGFLNEVAHWAAKGYRLGLHSLQSFERGDYYILMFAPAGDGQMLTDLRNS